VFAQALGISWGFFCLDSDCGWGKKELKRARGKFEVSAGMSATAFFAFVANGALPVQARKPEDFGDHVTEVTDETGRVVKLPAQIGRIVSLAPS